MISNEIHGFERWISWERADTATAISRSSSEYRNRRCFVAMRSLRNRTAWIARECEACGRLATCRGDRASITLPGTKRQGADMLNRRKILLSGAATAAVALFTSPLRAASATMAPPAPNPEAVRMQCDVRRLCAARPRSFPGNHDEPRPRHRRARFQRATTGLTAVRSRRQAGDESESTMEPKQLSTIDRTKLDGMDAISFDVVDVQSANRGSRKSTLQLRSWRSGRALYHQPAHGIVR